MHNIAIVNCLMSWTCRLGRVFVFIYLFGDKTDSEKFAFSVDRYGANIAPIRPQTD